MTTKTILQSIKIRNFKALRNSGEIRLTPLTVIIGNNGAGKSSVTDGLETFQTLATSGLDSAMQMWRGIEHARNKFAKRANSHKKANKDHLFEPIEFSLRGRWQSKPFSIRSAINDLHNENEILIESESVRFNGIVRTRDGHGPVTQKGEGLTSLSLAPFSKSILNDQLKQYVGSWQFLSLWPQAMGNPVPQGRTRGGVVLAKDGANIAEYLSDILRLDIDVFNGIIASLRYVLPYSVDIQPAMTSELERTMYLNMKEGDVSVPGWLLSTGTLRILAILALLRHPTPPPLIVIEEVENGLDPRTIHLLVGEIQEAVGSGRTQVLLTTHSPYLLDLIPLSCIVLADRVDGVPRFTRPADSKALQKWAKSFGPGQLYTMDRLGSTEAGK